MNRATPKNYRAADIRTMHISADVKKRIFSCQQELNNLVTSSSLSSEEVYSLSAKLDKLINDCYIQLDQSGK